VNTVLSGALIGGRPVDRNRTAVVVLELSPTPLPARENFCRISSLPSNVPAVPVASVKTIHPFAA
jgi:hypothetical protein